MRTSPLLVSAAIVLGGCGGHHGSSPAAPTLPDEIGRVDRSTAGTGGAGVDASAIRLSGDGRYAVFVSPATDLDPAASSGVQQVYRKDRLTGALTLISRAWGLSSRRVGDGNCYAPAISDDGRFVVFSTDATNLIADDFNGARDIYYVDVVAGTIVCASVASDGSESIADSDHPDISGDGRMVVYDSVANNLVAGDTNAKSDVFRTDMVTGTTIRLSVTTSSTQGTNHSSYPRVSADGNRIAFQSLASLQSSDLNGVSDIYLRDVLAGTTSRVSVGYAVDEADGASTQPAISRDGRYVAFTSAATNLVTGDTNGVDDIFVSDRSALAIDRVSLSDAGAASTSGSGLPSISRDGRYVVFWCGDALVTGDTNGQDDIYLRDRVGNRTRLVSRAASGALNDGASDLPTISADGSTVGFEAAGTVLPSDEVSRFHVYATPNPIAAGG